MAYGLEPTIEGLRQRVGRFVAKTFGNVNLESRHERCMRLVEEAIELAQSEGVPDHVVHAIADQVFAKPPGIPQKEAGGVGVTWLAWTIASDTDPIDLITAEIDRIEAKGYQDVAREKQRVKAARGTGLMLEEDRRDRE